jgi:acyl-CoA thioester hydrolase
MTQSEIAIHQKTFNIAWGDMDALGHVNHARYFDYFQEARIEWLAKYQVSLAEDMGPVVIQATCTFLKPVIYPATLTLKSLLSHMGKTSIIMNHLLYQGDALMAEGSCKIVWVDYRKNKSIPLPDAIRQLFDGIK